MGCARGAPCGRRWGGSDGVEARARGLLYTTHLLRRRPASHRPADRWSGQRRALARPPAGSSLGLLRALAPSAPSFRVPSCARSCWNETGWAGPGGPQQRGFIYPRENRVEAKRWSAGALALRTRQEWERRGQAGLRLAGPGLDAIPQTAYLGSLVCLSATRLPALLSETRNSFVANAASPVGASVCLPAPRPPLGSSNK